jgi:hypothetical protein
VALAFSFAIIGRWIVELLAATEDRMTSILLRRLETDDFHDSIGFMLPPPALRRVLQGSPDVSVLDAAIRDGGITDRDIRTFVGRLMEGFRVGVPFRDDLALAALAAAMENWDSAFAEEYLDHLARLNRAELNASVHVARECLKARRASVGA